MNLQTITCPRKIIDGKLKAFGLDYLLSKEGGICLGSSLKELLEKIEGKVVEVSVTEDKNGDVLSVVVYYKGNIVCNAMPMPRFRRTEKNENIQLLNDYWSVLAEVKKNKGTYKRSSDFHHLRNR